MHTYTERWRLICVYVIVVNIINASIFVAIILVYAHDIHGIVHYYNAMIILLTISIRQTYLIL